MPTLGIVSLIVTIFVVIAMIKGKIDEFDKRRELKRKKDAFDLLKKEVSEQQKLDLTKQDAEFAKQVLRRNLESQQALRAMQAVEEEQNNINAQKDSAKTKKDGLEIDITEMYATKSTQIKEIDPLKEKGDRYERYIGKQFEDKGDLVIYNGFIRGFEDGGVDIAVISKDAKTINLVQCKHWSLKILELDHIEKIYEKLNTHNLDFLRLSANQINEQLSTKKQNVEIEKSLLTAQNNEKTLLIRKTLYISSDKVVDLGIGKHLTMIQPNIFRYQDMKIVVEQHL